MITTFGHRKPGVSNILGSDVEFRVRPEVPRDRRIKNRGPAKRQRIEIVGKTFADINGIGLQRHVR